MTRFEAKTPMEARKIVNHAKALGGHIEKIELRGHWIDCEDGEPVFANRLIAEHIRTKRVRVTVDGETGELSVDSDPLPGFESRLVVFVLWSGEEYNPRDF